MSSSTLTKCRPPAACNWQQNCNRVTAPVRDAVKQDWFGGEWDNEKGMCPWFEHDKKESTEDGRTT